MTQDPGVRTAQKSRGQRGFVVSLTYLRDRRVTGSWLLVLSAMLPCIPVDPVCAIPLSSAKLLPTYSLLPLGSAHTLPVYIRCSSVWATFLYFFTYFSTPCFLPEWPKSAILKLTGKPVASCFQRSLFPCNPPKQAPHPPPSTWFCPACVVTVLSLVALLRTLLELRLPSALARPLDSSISLYVLQVASAVTRGQQVYK